MSVTGVTSLGGGGFHEHDELKNIRRVHDWSPPTKYWFVDRVVILEFFQ
jgi:hypothetical protein